MESTVLAPPGKAARAAQRHPVETSAPHTVLQTCEKEALIVDELKAMLKATHYSDVARLDVHFHEGVVTISGTLTSWYQLSLAQETVRRHKKVGEVVRHVEVNYAA